MNNTTMTQRWQAAAKQGLCLLLCLLMFVTLLPVKAYAAAKVDRTQALARIAQLQKELEGKYFTTTGNPCNKPGTASHGCTKCTNANVIKASWFKKAVSLIPSTISNTIITHTEKFLSFCTFLLLLSFQNLVPVLHLAQ